jgi:hypothetical protein
MIKEQWLGKNVDETAGGLTEVLSHHLFGTTEKQKNPGPQQAEIRTGHLTDYK